MASYILRNVDPKLWKQVKHEAIDDGMSVKELIEKLLRDFIASRQKVGQ